jgi:hypothetical protein
MLKPSKLEKKVCKYDGQKDGEIVLIHLLYSKSEIRNHTMSIPRECQYSLDHMEIFRAPCRRVVVHASKIPSKFCK